MKDILKDKTAYILANTGITDPAFAQVVSVYMGVFKMCPERIIAAFEKAGIPRGIKDISKVCGLDYRNAMRNLETAWTRSPCVANGTLLEECCRGSGVGYRDLREHLQAD